MIFAYAATVFAAEIPSDTLAKSILAKAGIRAGVCAMPRVSDGKLAAALLSLLICSRRPLGTWELAKQLGGRSANDIRPTLIRLAQADVAIGSSLDNRIAGLRDALSELRNGSDGF